MRAFYERFHGYCMGICMAYSKDRDDALEMMNDGFLKAFKNLNDLKNIDVLMAWLRRIMVNTSIDYYRKNTRNQQFNFTSTHAEDIADTSQNDVSIYAQLSADEIMKVVQQLQNPYKMVFNLYVLEGFSHKEIAAQLGIVESTSRSHLSEANKTLRFLLTKMTNTKYESPRR